MAKNKVYTETQEFKNKTIFTHVYVNNTGEVQKIMGEETGIMSNAGYLWRKQWNEPLEPHINQMTDKFIAHLRAEGVKV